MKAITRGLLMFATGCLALPAFAQNSARPPRDLEEVIVTAQKREERLQEVPISMSVLDGNFLDASTVKDVTEILSRVPGVSVNQFFLGGGSQIPVRGVSASSVINSGASPTAYYLDSVPFGFVKSAIGPDPGPYDLDRVEVLRGPQGTLYGASALNGVVRILTKDANLDELEFKARTLASSTEGEGGENYRGDMAVNVPIIEGKLAARAVVGYQDLSGWIDKPNMNKRDVNDAELGTMRLKINAQITDQLSIGAFGWLSRSDYGAPSLGIENGRSTSPIDEPTSTDYDAYGLKVDYDFPSISITSMTSYLDYANDAILLVLPVGRFTTNLEATTFAQEVVLNSTHGGGWRWTAGGIYRDSEDRRSAHFPAVFPVPDRLANTSESYAVFGELTRTFLDGKFELTGGLRYFEDEVGLRERSRLAFVQPAQYVNKDAKFSATTPRFVLAWHPSQQVTLYTSYGEGFRSGAHQVPTAAAIGFLPPLKPDTLRNYEVGAKGNLLGGRLNFDTAAYYIDWTDVQRFVTVIGPNSVPFTGLVNGDSASGVGFDFGVTAQPVDGLELGVNFGWNDLTADSDVLSSGVVLVEKGERLDLSAEYTIGASADYAFPLGRSGFQGRFSASANYTSEQETRGIAAGVRVVRSGDAMLIGRTSFSLMAPDHWVATLFVDNVNNEDGSPVRFANSDPNWDVQVRPRTIGAQIEYRF